MIFKEWIILILLGVFVGGAYLYNATLTPEERELAKAQNVAHKAKLAQDLHPFVARFWGFTK